ncbi:MAG TPA: ABC transporter substrate-binding protein [Thermoanaerobaculia bacterium]|nr:ABC transporter substrate-binding protein [Thermoanaerobaculia bacterium]
MKRTLARAAAVLAVSVFAACGPRSPSAAPKDTLYRHLGGDPATLDPTTTTEESGILVEAMIFRPLLGLDTERRPVSALARTWTVAPDGLTYQFGLDPYAEWEDGSPVTSDDVLFTIERIRDPKVPAFNLRDSFSDVAAIETPDASTIRVRFKFPNAQRLLAFNLPIVSRAAFARAATPADVDRRPTGSGPYRLEKWETNRSITLVRRDGAPGASARFRRVVFRVVPDSTVRFRAGARGDLDEFRIGRDQRASAESSPEFLAKNRILKVPQPVTAYLLWNLRHPFLADPRVRRALAHSWHREETARRLYPPDGAALVSGPYLPNSAESDPAVPPTPYDPALAARLLDEAGWRVGPGGVRTRGGAKASLELLYPVEPTVYGALAEILRSAYAKVGVVLELKKLDWAAYSERADAGEFDSHLTARVFLPPNPDPYPHFHSSQFPPRGQNYGFYRNPAADRAMEAARSETDPEKRLALYREVHRLLADDPPADFLWGADQYWGISRRVEGVTVSSLGLFHFLPGPLGWKPAAP